MRSDCAHGSAERLRCVDARLCKGNGCVKTGVRKSTVPQLHALCQDYRPARVASKSQ